MTIISKLFGLCYTPNKRADKVAKALNDKLGYTATKTLCVSIAAVSIAIYVIVSYTAIRYYGMASGNSLILWLSAMIPFLALLAFWVTFSYLITSLTGLYGLKQKCADTENNNRSN